MNRTHPLTLFGFRLRTLALVALVGLLALAALALDLLNEGRVYDALWNLTGETEPAGQILGFGQYLANWTRDQPETLPYAQVAHADVNPFGVNTLLEQEVEPQKRERQVQMIAEAGFGWIRQQFPWEDIEIAGKGDFIDRRNDLNGDGEPDAISAWAKYDHIVDLADQYDLAILARLSGPTPEWARPPGATGAPPPPADAQASLSRGATRAASSTTRSGTSRTSTLNGVSRRSMPRRIRICCAAPRAHSRRSIPRL
jgi:hypothetical protein